jgi:hypothetical protein
MSTPMVTVEIAQGATLVVPFNVLIDGLPANLSGAGFKSTLKTDPKLPDTDPTVVMVDWTGKGTYPPGRETWVVPAELTQDMQAATWFGLVRSSGIPGLPTITDLFQPRVIVIQALSSRF